MKELVGNVVLLNRTTARFEDAQVYRELDQKNVDDFERLWKPEFAQKVSTFTKPADYKNADVQDSHWNWVGIVARAAKSMGQETFAVECNGATQGLMLIDLTQFARLDEQKGRELVYVDRLATAPWNRPKFIAKPRYKGVGRVLIATAVSVSIEAGFEGRIGLHSLPQSASWYREQARFTDLGLDVSKEMHYFEATKAQAVAFLK